MSYSREQVIRRERFQRVLHESFLRSQRRWAAYGARFAVGQRVRIVGSQPALFGVVIEIFRHQRVRRYRLQDREFLYSESDLAE